MVEVDNGPIYLIQDKLDPILIVDDEGVNRALLERFIQSFGFEVLIAKNGEEAVEFINTKVLSLIICDQYMPGLQGTEVLNWSQQLQPNAVRILLTGSQDPEIAKEAINVGRVNYFLSKPCDQGTLKVTLDSALEHHRALKRNQELHQQLLKQHATLATTHHTLMHDLQLGKRIREEMLLGKIPKQAPTLDIDAITLASKEMDGDFYDFFQASMYHLDLVVGDVMGKGIPAAVIATAVKAHLERFATPVHRTQSHSNGIWSEDIFKPHEILHYVHENLIQQLIKLEYFVSIFYSRFDIAKRLFSYVDCGFTKPLHCTKKGIKTLRSETPALGIAETPSYQTLQVHYEPGDLFVFYSDGITEAQNQEGEFFGLERLIALVEENQTLSSNKLLEAIKDKVFNFTQSTELKDDFTLVVVKITKESIPQIVAPKAAKFKSDLSQLGAVRDFIDRICKNAPYENEILSQQMQLAINEIFCNIVDHGLENSASRDIVIEAKLGDEGVTFDIADQGPPFDPQNTQEPSLAGDKDDGFGWHLIKRIADKVTYYHKKSEDGWNHLQIYKEYKVREYTMEMSHTLQDGVLIITPQISTLDAKEVPEFKDTIKNILDNKNASGSQKIVLNMEKIDFVDSSGLGCFLSLMRQLRGSGGQLKLAKMKRSVKTIFDLVSMNKAFEIFETLEDAVKSFK